MYTPQPKPAERRRVLPRRLPPSGRFAGSSRSTATASSLRSAGPTSLPAKCAASRSARRIARESADGGRMTRAVGRRGPAPRRIRPPPRAHPGRSYRRHRASAPRGRCAPTSRPFSSCRRRCDRRARTRPRFGFAGRPERKRRHALSAGAAASIPRRRVDRRNQSRRRRGGDDRRLRHRACDGLFTRRHVCGPRAVSRDALPTASAEARRRAARELETPLR